MKAYTPIVALYSICLKNSTRGYSWFASFLSAAETCAYEKDAGVTVDRGQIQTFGGVSLVYKFAKIAPLKDLTERIRLLRLNCESSTEVRAASNWIPNPLSFCLSSI